MIRIEIESAEIHTRSGVSSRTGKPYTMREQEAWAHVTDRDGKPQKFPTKIKVMLAEDQNPFLPGNYTLSPASLWVDRFGGLSITPVLAEMKTAAVPTSKAA